VCVWLFRVIELQSKLDDVVVERRSLADSASSPVDDELRDISDTSLSSDRPPAVRPPPPPSVFGFIPPFYGRRPLPHFPPVFDAYRGDTFVRESPRPRDASPTSGRRPMHSEHNRYASPYDNYRDEAYMGRSPPPRGNSPQYYETRNGRRSPPIFDGYCHDERYGRHSPRARENSPQRRDWYSRLDKLRTSDEESSAMPSGSSRMRSHPPAGEERSYPSRYTPERNVVGPDTRSSAARPPHTLDDDDYPTY